MTMPKITVVIPLYNKAAYIQRCLDSVLQQTYKDYEIIVVDDGSTDNSLETVYAYGALEHLKIIRQSNAGPAAARNTGLRNAQGEWIVFLDADDEFLPDALQVFSDLIEQQQGVDYVTCNYYIRSNGESRLFTDIKIDSLIKHPFLFEYLCILSGRPGSEIIKREVMMKYMYDESIRRYEDAEEQYRILNSSKVYQCSTPVMITNRDCSEAAGFRKEFSEDFLSKMDFRNKSFWERMQLYKLSLEALYGYKEKAEILYGDIYCNRFYIYMHKYIQKYWQRLGINRKQWITNILNTL